MPKYVDHCADKLEKFLTRVPRESDLELCTAIPRDACDITMRLPLSRMPRIRYMTELPRGNWPRQIATTYQDNAVGSFAGNYDMSMTTPIRAGSTLCSFDEYVTFVHEEEEHCFLFDIDEGLYDVCEINERIHSLVISDYDEDCEHPLYNLKLAGPATLRDTPESLDRILYTCKLQKCIIPCVCMICNGFVECEEHPEILHPGFFHREKHLFTVKNADSFNINYNEENLEFFNKRCTNRTCEGIHGNHWESCGPGGCTCQSCPLCTSVDVFKYPGAEADCKECKEDLLDHEAYHFIYHYKCRFCRESRIRFQDVLDELDYWNDHYEARDQESRSCKFCYKILFDKSTLRRHINTVHKKTPEKLFLCTNAKNILVQIKRLNITKKLSTKKQMKTCLVLFVTNCLDLRKS